MRKKYVKQEIVRNPFKIPSYPASPAQQAIFDWALANEGSLQIEAVAGSGKSTTIQWLMMLYKEPGLALAFNSIISKALQASVPDWIQASTCHASGFGEARRAFKSCRFLEGKTFFIMRELFPKLYDPDKSKCKSVHFRNRQVQRLISLCKSTLTDPGSQDKLIRLIDTYVLDLGDEMMDILETIPHIMKECMDRTSVVDFDDMMWLSVVKNLDMTKYPVVYVDECQDLNNLMIEYVKRLTGGRAIKVGDRCQAIYGFSGANTNSIDTLKGMFDSHELPLDVCYRCGSDIVEYAQRIVSHIKPWEGADTGIVTEQESIFDHPDGSMILCRRNAPLVKPCLQLIKEGRKAIIKGKDIGKGLIDLVNSVKADTSAGVVDGVRDNVEHRIANIMGRKTVNVGAIEQLQDSLDVIESIAETCATKADIELKINSIFAEGTTGIVLSSIHKAKGLEADEVSIIDYSQVRLHRDGQTEEMAKQEANLEYVAITRARKKLNLVR